MKILVTGGAGFIGSNLVDALLKRDDVSLVRVMDNLSTGFRQNMEMHSNDPRFEFFEADIRDFDQCMKAMSGIDLVSHQAALGSVPRSIADPLTSHHVNVTGALNIFEAARQSAIRRIVYAASSSTYGDHPALPKKEENIGRPLSPYAVTKYVNELYAGVYADTYSMQFIGLRYFNIFGPRQNPGGPYAAVIPLFIKQLLNNTAPVINGDGSYSRDFTYVDNAVQANMLALFTENREAINQVYNIACGEQTSLITLYNSLKEAAGSSLDAVFAPFRKGDVAHSLADISKAKQSLSYQPGIRISEGLGLTFDWYKNHPDRI